MWRKEDGNAQVSPDVSNQPSSSTHSSKAGAVGGAPKVTACVSQGIRIKGDVTGSEDLFIDGSVEGKITLENSGVTVGPNGTVKADIVARELTFRGSAEGKFTAEDRIQIWNTARVQGELKSQRISIEDGAELRGKIEAGKVSNKITPDETAGRGRSKAADVTAKNANTTTGAATAGAD